MSQALIMRMVLMFAFLAAALYFAYPYIEQWVKNKINNHVNACQKLSYEMYEEMSRQTIVLIITSLTLGLALVGFWITRGQGWVQLLFTVGFGLVGFHILTLVLRQRWEKRLALFDEQLVDGLTLLANSIKSGMNLSQGIRILVTEMPNPISQEFGTVMSQEQLGRTLDEAFESMLERIPSHDLSIAINSILILRETGGDLSETFETISETIRQRRKIEGKIASMTAQGKTQGAILMALPFVLMIAMYYMNPGFIMPLIKTELGWVLIFMMLVFQGVGYMWMRKIIKIDV